MKKEHDGTGNTTVQIGQTKSPRLPHEHDESQDSQEHASEQANREVIKRAHDDIVTGKKDTDLRGTPGLDETR